jgi:hypothetical protein
MPVATARRAESVDKRKGRPGKSSPFQIHHISELEDKGNDWRAQLLSLRHHVSPSISILIFALHFGEARDA